MKETQRSVTQEQYQKYIDMKKRFERDAGPGASAMAGITGPTSAPAASSGSVPAAGPAAADQPSLLGDGNDSDSDDIYG